MSAGQGPSYGRIIHLFLIKWRNNYKIGLDVKIIIIIIIYTIRRNIDHRKYEYVNVLKLSVE